MTIKHATKAQAVALKSAPSDEGQFEALVAVFNNIDSYGDVILKGAFTDTLKEWGDSGYPVPVVWSHDKDDPFSHIGVVTEAKETDTGLLVKAQLDLDNPKAAQVHKLLKGGRVKEFSFAFSYAMEDVNPAKRDGVEVRELKKLKLYEVGPTMVGANPSTQLIGVKSLGENADPEPPEAPAEDDPKPDDDTGGDDWAEAAEIVTEVSNLLTRLSDIITRNTEPDDSDEEDAGDSDEASRGQTDDDETNGKSSEVSADRSAEEQKALAEFYSAILQEDSDESQSSTC